MSEVNIPVFKDDFYDALDKVCDTLGIEINDSDTRWKIEKATEGVILNTNINKAAFEKARDTYYNLPEKFTAYAAYVTEDGVPCSVPLSFARCGDDCYCMTDMKFSHSRYFVSHKFAYISLDNIQMKCEIRFWGSTRTKNSLMLPELFQRNYADNWARYGLLPDQVFFEFRIFEVKRWDYVNNIPFRSTVKWDLAHSSDEVECEEYKTMYSKDDQ